MESAVHATPASSGAIARFRNMLRWHSNQLTQHYLDWINDLKDRATRARTRSGCIVWGYRVYFTERGETLIVLLIGGDKSTQDQDIELALQPVRTYRM
jgi:putative component of toxin-antitoxin plasmid stabilization module